MKKTCASIVLMLFSFGTFATQPTKGPLHSIEINDFLQLPESLQMLYVAGAIDGITFISYGYDLKDHDALVNCYRQQTLGVLTKKVVELTRSKKDSKASMAALIAMTTGKLCKH